MLGIGSIISFLICLVLLIVIAKVVFKGTKSLFGFLINTAVGVVVLWILDMFDIIIPINWVTAAIVGLLGVPGVILLGVLRYVFHLI